MGAEKPTADKSFKSPATAQKRVLAIRSKITENVFLLADTIDAVGKHGVKAQTFFRDAGVSEEDFSALSKLRRISNDRREELIRQGVSFETLKTVMQVDVRAGARALRKLLAGIHLGPADVRSIETDLRNRKTSVLEDLYTQFRKRHESVLATRVKASEERFTALAKVLHSRMIDHAALSGEDRAVSYLQIREAASELLDEFEAIFGKEHAPVEDWFFVGADDKLGQQLAESHHALLELSAGRFAEDFPTIDPKEFRALPHFTRMLPVWKAIDSIRFLAGELPKKAPPRGNNVRPIRKLLAIELCAGIGGQALGLHSAGFKLAGVYEKDDVAAQTIAINGERWQPRVGDIKAELEELLVNISERLARRDGGEHRLDLLAGALPWREWDDGAKGENDHDELFSTTRRIIERFRPRAFYFETVRGFTKTAHIQHFNRLTDQYNNMGYEVRVFAPNFLDYGIPQVRDKIYIVGIERKYSARLHLPVVQAVKHRTVAETLDPIIFKHRRRPGKFVVEGKSSIRELTREEEAFGAWVDKWAATYGTAKQVPDLSRGLNNYVRQSVQLDAADIRPAIDETTGKNKRGRPRKSVVVEPKLKILDETADEWTEHGFSVRTRGDSVAKTVAEADTKLMPLTIDVLKQLQGIPAWWQFAGTLEEQVRHLCEATPPVIALALGRSIHAALTGEIIDINAPGGLSVRPSPQSSSGSMPTMENVDNPQRWLAGIWHGGIKSMSAAPPPAPSPDDDDWDEEDDDFFDDTELYAEYLEALELEDGAVPA